jgi:hypothetical protein
VGVRLSEPIRIDLVDAEFECYQIRSPMGAREELFRW